jgi:cytochrome c-type biogenesis protein CcmH
VAAALMVIVVGSPVAAGGNASSVAADISDEIMSPFCDGVTLHDCPSRAALDLRVQIEEWAASGSSKAQILDRLEAEYGPGIRSTPPIDGSGIVAWLLPAIAVLGGCGAAWLLARRWTRTRSIESAAELGPEERARVEAELAEFRTST